MTGGGGPSGKAGDRMGREGKTISNDTVCGVI